MARRNHAFFTRTNPAAGAIPCREGTSWLEKILNRFSCWLGAPGRHRHDRRAFEEHVGGGRSARLGDAAAMPTISIVQKFRNEFEDHLQGRCCVQQIR